PFLHDIEQPDLNFPGQVGQFIDGEYAAVRTWQKAIVDAQFAADCVSSLCRFDGIDIPDDVRDGYVRGGQFFDIAFFPASIFDRCFVALFLHKIPTTATYWVERIVVNLTTCDDRKHLIEKVRQPSQNPAFRLASKTQED